jgi:antitoxin ParD1/3/4
MCQIRYSSDMANRTTVNISITPELDAFLKSRVQSGRYQTTSEVVREALRLLERQENEREEARRQLKAKLERGAAQAGRGELLDGDKVFDELREMIKERKRAKQKARVR